MWPFFTRKLIFSHKKHESLFEERNNLIEEGKNSIQEENNSIEKRNISIESVNILQMNLNLKFCFTCENVHFCVKMAYVKLFQKIPDFSCENGHHKKMIEIDNLIEHVVLLVEGFACRVPPWSSFDDEFFL